MGIQCISSNEKNLELKMKFIITVPELDTREKYRQKNHPQINQKHFWKTIALGYIIFYTT